MSTLKMWRYSRALRLGLASALGLTLLAGLLLTLVVTGSPVVALAQDTTIRYVAPAPTGNDSGNNCTSSSAPCATVQHAVDVAAPGDEIRVASGTYTDVQPRAGVTQATYINKTVKIRGGYSTSNWSASDPEANPTELDAQGHGRVFYITGGVSPTLEGLRITGGNATLGGNGAGGGIYVVTATITFRNNRVFSNTARDGGGLYIQNTGGVLLANNTISGNNSIDIVYGGGLHFNESYSATLTGNTIRENRAWRGGGLYFYHSPGATLDGNTIIENVGVGPGWNFGGGLYCESSDDMTLTGNVIRANRSTGNFGGGLCFLACDNIELAANTISDNSSPNGSGLHVEGGTDVELTDNLISNNSGNRGGGANFVSTDNVTLTGNIVISNSAGPVAPREGGGLRFIDDTNVNLVGNIITNNSTDDFGGGLYLENSEVIMTNNVIARNSALEGDGIYMIGDAVLTGRHNTLVGSSGEGLRLNSAGDSATLTNTIFATFTTAVNVQAGTATLERTLWFGNGTRTIGVTPPDGNNPVYGDPAFADDGYHLTFSSAAIDKGVDAGVKTDIDGDSRPCRLGPDLGADEISCRYLPIILKNH